MSDKNYTHEWYQKVNKLIASKELKAMSLDELKLVKEACSNTMFNKAVAKEKYYDYFKIFQEVDQMIEGYEDEFTKELLNNLF